DHLGGRLSTDVGVDQRLREPLPGLLVEILEQRRLDLGSQRLAGLAQALAQASEATDALLLRRLAFRGSRWFAVDDEQITPITGHDGGAVTTAGRQVRGPADCA